MKAFRFPRPLAAFASNCGINLWVLYKIEGGRRATEDQAVAIHLASRGQFPCWDLRPDRWSKGYLPPQLLVLAEARGIDAAELHPSPLAA